MQSGPLSREFTWNHVVSPLTAADKYITTQCLKSPSNPARLGLSVRWNTHLRHEKMTSYDTAVHVAVYETPYWVCFKLGRQERDRYVWLKYTFLAKLIWFDSSTHFLVNWFDLTEMLKLWLIVPQADLIFLTEHFVYTNYFDWLRWLLPIKDNVKNSYPVNFFFREQQL